MNQIEDCTFKPQLMASYPFDGKNKNKGVLSPRRQRTQEKAELTHYRQQLEKHVN